MQLPDQIIERLRRLTCLHSGTRVQFRLPDASDFYVSLGASESADRVVSQFGHTDEPALVLEMSDSTLGAILNGRLSARHAFLLGDIRYTGDRDLAASMADMFPAE